MKYSKTVKNLVGTLLHYSTMKNIQVQKYKQRIFAKLLFCIFLINLQKKCFLQITVVWLTYMSRHICRP